MVLMSKLPLECAYLGGVLGLSVKVHSLDPAIPTLDGSSPPSLCYLLLAT
jgi:hypothetical protein